MNRYCPNCKKEYDFPIKSMTDLDNLICPECNIKIDKNSRKPVDNTQTERNEAAIGRAISGIFYFLFIFYFVCSIIGIIAYFLKQNLLLYLMTILCLVFFIAQYCYRGTRFRLSFILVPIGAALGWYFLKTTQGVCFGILCAFIVRHIIRDIIWRLIMWLVRLIRRV